MAKILIVDDEKAIRTMLLDYLENRFQVVTAEHAEAALKMLERERFDLVISDINMPGMSGPQLLKEIRAKYQGVKTALITAYNIDDYVRIAKENSITNIIPKTVPFNFNELDSIVDSLLTGNIFGLQRYLKEDCRVIGEYCVRSSKEARDIREHIIEVFLEKFGTAGDMKLILDEIITNAIYHAPVDMEGSEKYHEFAEVTLQPEEYVYVTSGYDSEKYGVSVLDLQGRLKKETVLYKIDRQITGEGLLDDSGRGIHMSRLFADRMVINIDPNKKTEVILMNYFSHKYRGYKPLYINEL
jgi:CheY-like chemotaxis protein